METLIPWEDNTETGYAEVVASVDLEVFTMKLDQDDLIKDCNQYFSNIMNVAK